MPSFEAAHIVNNNRIEEHESTTVSLTTLNHEKDCEKSYSTVTEEVDCKVISDKEPTDIIEKKYNITPDPIDLCNLKGIISSTSTSSLEKDIMECNDDRLRDIIAKYTNDSGIGIYQEEEDGRGDKGEQMEFWEEANSGSECGDLPERLI